MNRREAIAAAIAALLGGPVVASADKPGIKWFRSRGTAPRSVRGLWEFDICRSAYVAILDEFTTTATGLNPAWMANIELRVFVCSGTTQPVWLAEIPLPAHRNRLALENGWLVNKLPHQTERGCP